MSALMNTVTLTSVHTCAPPCTCTHSSVFGQWQTAMSHIICVYVINACNAMICIQNNDYSPQPYPNLYLELRLCLYLHLN